MAISDAQFAAWLKGDRKRVVLVEQDFGYESAGAPAVGTVYLSDSGYVTGPTDTPASVRYHMGLAKAPRLRRSIDRRTLGGRAQLTVSDLVLDNRDGRFDFLLDLVIDGYECRFYLGAPRGTPGWSRSDFRIAGVAVAERVVASGEREITVKLKDKRLLLDRDLMGVQVGGTSADATQFLGLYWGGYHFNIEAKLYDSATATYTVLSNNTGASAVEVRDKGGSLTEPNVTVQVAGIVFITADAGTDTLTVTAHGLSLNDVVKFFDSSDGIGFGVYAPFAGLTADQQYWVINPTADTFQLSATKGGSAVNITGTTYLGFTGASSSGRMEVKRYFDDINGTGRIQLSSSAIGRVTVDLRASTAYSTAPFAFLEHLATAYGNLDGAEIDSAAFTAADTALDAKIDIGYTNYSVPVRANLLDVMDELVGSVFGWYGQSRDGLLTCGLVDVSGISSATATRTLERKNLARGAEIAVENDMVGPSRVSVLYGLNHTVQTDGILDSVDEDDRRTFATRYISVQRSAAPTGTAYSTNKPAYHRTMVEAEPQPAAEMSTTIFCSDAALPIGDYAGELVADSAPIRQFITAPCRLEFFDVELGEVVEIDYPRFGLSGVNARVIGIDLDLSSGVVTLDLVRQVSPDITTSSYH